MEKQLLFNFVENQANGYILLNNQLKIEYANKVMREVLEDFEDFYSNFVSCGHVSNELVCQMGFNSCGKCRMKRNLMKVLEGKSDRWATNIPFKSKNQIIFFDCFIQYIEGYICIQFFNLFQKNDEYFFLEKLLDHVKDLVFYKDHELRYRYVNQAYADFLQKDKDNILDKTDYDLLPEEMVQACLSSDLLALEKREIETFEKVGDSIYKVSKTKIRGGILAIAKDVTSEYQQSQLAYLDELTQLPNRRKFLDDINKIYQLEQHGYYLLLIDLDGLREINTSLGHKGGDLYLETLGSILAHNHEGQFYRLAGDEFVALIQGTKKDITKVLDDICSQLNQLNLNPKLTISTGGKKLNLKLSFSENYELTDKLLYQAKAKGKNIFILE